MQLSDPIFVLIAIFLFVGAIFLVLDASFINGTIEMLKNPSTEPTEKSEKRRAPFSGRWYSEIVYDLYIKRRNRWYLAWISLASLGSLLMLAGFYYGALITGVDGVELYLPLVLGILFITVGVVEAFRRLKDATAKSIHVTT